MKIGEKWMPKYRREVITPDPRVTHYLGFKLQTHYQPGVTKPTNPTKSPVLRTRDVS